MTTLTQKSQVTIPKDIRETMGLKPGDEVEFDIEDGQVLLHKKLKKDIIEKYIGYLGKGSTEEAMRELRG